MTAAPGSRKGKEAKQLRDNLRLLTNAFRDRVEAAMRPQGLTVPQLRMLFAIQRDAQASAAAIARQCQVTPQTLQIMLQRAERERWIVRSPAPHNARVRNATLTATGEAVLAKAFTAVEAFEAEAWRDVSIADLQRMNRHLEQALDRIGQTAAPEAGLDPKRATRAKDTAKSAGRDQRSRR